MNNCRFNACKGTKKVKRKRSKRVKVINDFLNYHFFTFLPFYFFTFCKTQFAILHQRMLVEVLLNLFLVVVGDRNHHVVEHNAELIHEWCLLHMHDE